MFDNRLPMAIYYCPRCKDTLTLSAGMFMLFKYNCCGERMKPLPNKEPTP